MYAHANLFRTLCTNFYQNRQSFVDDMTNILAYFFLGHGVYVCLHVYCNICV